MIYSYFIISNSNYLHFIYITNLIFIFKCNLTYSILTTNYLYSYSLHVDTSKFNLTSLYWKVYVIFVKS